MYALSIIMFPKLVVSLVTLRTRPEASENINVESSILEDSRYWVIAPVRSCRQNCTTFSSNGIALLCLHCLLSDDLEMILKLYQSMDLEKGPKCDAAVFQCFRIPDTVVDFWYPTLSLGEPVRAVQQVLS